MAGVDIHSAWARHVRPDVLELAIRSEHLDALIFAVGDINVTVAVGADIVWQTELPRLVSRLSPRAQQTAVGRILVYLRIAVTVGHEQLTAPRMNRHVSTAEQWQPAHAFGGLAAGPKRQQHLPIRRTFSNRMVEGVGQPYGVIGADRDRVRIGEDFLVSPAA